MLCDCFREVEVFGEAMQTKKFETCEIPEHTLNTMIMSESCPKVDVSCFEACPKKNCSWALEGQKTTSVRSPASHLLQASQVVALDHLIMHEAAHPQDHLAKTGSSYLTVGFFSRKIFHQQILSRYNLTVVNSFANLYLEVKISWFQIWKITQMVSRTAPADVTCLQNLLAEVRSDELQSMS